MDMNEEEIAKELQCINGIETIAIKTIIEKGRFNTRRFAKGIYDAGYRKADEVRKETAQKIFDYFNSYSICTKETEFYHLREINANMFYKFLRKYGVEVK